MVGFALQWPWASPLLLEQYGDFCRSSSAAIPILGIIRLTIELLLVGFATWAFYEVGFNRLALIFGILVIIHYLLSHDRIIWLLSK